ncbi:MAG: hypothetical protein V3U80_00995 [Flavobacteriaceae bacterium]
MDVLGTIINLAGGALGGNGAGGILKKLSLGTMGNTVVGLIGSLVMKYVPALSGLINLGGDAAASGGGDMMGMLSGLLSGGLGGGVLMTVVGLIKNVLLKK